MRPMRVPSPSMAPAGKGFVSLRTRTPRRLDWSSRAAMLRSRCASARRRAKAASSARRAVLSSTSSETSQASKKLPSSRAISYVSREARSIWPLMKSVLPANTSVAASLPDSSQNWTMLSIADGTSDSTAWFESLCRRHAFASR
ncbi:hypothetical protein [Sorangium cellulosum]|nr:hypothetical protein [Sorangium cellulosum]